VSERAEPSTPTTPPPAAHWCRGANDGDRSGGKLRDPLAHRPEQEPFESTGATRAEHEQVGRVAGLEQRPGRQVAHHALIDGCVITEGLSDPRRQSGTGIVLGVIVLEIVGVVWVVLIEIVPCEHRFQSRAVQLRLLGGPTHGGRGVLRPVGADDDPVHGRTSRERLLQRRRHTPAGFHHIVPRLRWPGTVENRHLTDPNDVDFGQCPPGGRSVP
jgi:hypothetical protein